MRAANAALALLPALLAAAAGCGPAAKPQAAGFALPTIEVGEDVKAAGLKLLWWEPASERSAGVTLGATKRALSPRAVEGSVTLKATAYGEDGTRSASRAWFVYDEIKPGFVGRGTLHVSGERGFAGVGRVVVGLE